MNERTAHEGEATMQQLLEREETHDPLGETLVLPRRPLLNRPKEPSPKPLWLTPSEAELLVSLCMASSSDGGPDETELFAKLGRFVKSFRL
jgi:hypothetical protein